MIEPDERRRILATIPRGDAQLPLLLHRAPGTEPRDLVVYLHGMAEDEVDPDSPMPRIFTDLGMDVLRFNYAGLHGIPGVHTLSSGLDDVQAILDALDAGTIDADLKPARTVLVGYSFGSAVALLSAAADPRVDAVAALAIGDHGRMGRILADPGSAVAQRFREAVHQVYGPGNPVPGTAPSVFLDDLVDHAERFDFLRIAPDLLATPVLLFHGVADDVFPAEEHFVPLYRALVQASHPRLEADLLPTDHAFAGIDVPGLLQRVATWIAADRA